MSRQKKTSQETPVSEDTTQSLSRREFLSLSAGAALALQLGVVGCSAPPENQNNNQNNNNQNNNNQNNNNQNNNNQNQKDACKPDVSVDKGKEVAFDAASIPQNDKQFSLGVQAGVMQQTSALLWGFAEDKKAKRLRVWREAEKAGQVVQVWDKDVTPEDGFFHVPIEGLAPGQRYHYAFLEGSADAWTGRSRIGSFRTAFADDCKQPVRVAATACTNVHKYKEFKALQYMAKQDIDVMCHMGDFSYNDGANTAEEFHNKWRQTMQAPGYPEILAHAGLYATWDDHESINNDKLYDQPPKFRKTAREAYLRHVAQPQGQPGGRFWGSYRWGLTAEFFVLDCRGERESAKKLYISKEQMDWLKKGLAESPCHFKVVLNSVPIIAWPQLWKVVADDRWEGYPEQRNELLDHITDEKIRNVWFLGGDYHVGVVAKLEKEGPRNDLWEIMVGPGGNVLPANLAALLQAMGNDREAIAPPAQFEMFEPRIGATILTFDPIQDHVHVQFIDPETEKPYFDKKLSQKS